MVIYGDFLYRIDHMFDLLGDVGTVGIGATGSYRVERHFSRCSEHGLVQLAARDEDEKNTSSHFLPYLW